MKNNSNIYITIKSKDKIYFINKLKELNIEILNIKIKKSKLIIKISYDSYLLIKKYVKSVQYKPVKYEGLILFKKIFSLYKIEIVIIILNFLIFVFAFNFIVEVELNINNKDLYQTLKYELENYGIKEYSYKKNYQNIEKIKEKIKEKYSKEIEWIEISKKGMKYIVELEPRIINNPSSKDKYCNVIATKDGLIKNIKIRKGELKIDIGDYVKKGDILLSSDIYKDENIVNQVCSDGDFYAEIWYKTKIKIPLVYYEKVKTGKKRKNIVLSIGDIKYTLLNDRLSDYESSLKKIFDVFGVKIYVKTDYEIRKVQKKYTEEEATTKALNLVYDKIKDTLGTSDIIEQEKVLQKYSNNSTIELDIFTITREQIGKRVILKEGNIDGS